MIDCVNDVKDGKLGNVCDKEKLSVGEAIEELVQNPRIKEAIVINAQNSGWRFLPLECISHWNGFLLLPRCLSIFSLFYSDEEPNTFRGSLAGVLLATEMDRIKKRKVLELRDISLCTSLNIESIFVHLFVFSG